MNFREAQDYLLSLGNEVSAMKLGLEKIRRLLAELGDPQNSYLKVQVAGTNGKGSVCAFLNSICVAAKIKTGMYTSPHLVSITERVQIDGEPISEERFADLASKVREVSERLVSESIFDTVPTFFEQVTAIALLAFAEDKVELAILETGLGGRLDATTAANAEIAAITRIDLDHQQYLGDTIEEIAGEKAAIIHSNSRVVALKQERQVNQVIEGRCRELGVDIEWVSSEVTTRKHDEVPNFPIRSRTFQTRRRNYPDVVLGLAGSHQTENAAVAIVIAEALADHGHTVSDNDMWIGLETARHPGRLERIDRFLLDGAHNISGARALKDYLDEFVDGPITMIFGAMADKEVGSILGVLIPSVDCLVLTTPPNSRAMPTDEMVAMVPDAFDRKDLYVTSSVASAIEKAIEVSGSDQVIVATGSLYLVGEVRKNLLDKLKTDN